MNVTIVDYNVGNIRSIVNMLGLFKNLRIKISSDRNEILKSDKLILPGVGAFGNAMDKINKLKLKFSEATLSPKINAKMAAWLFTILDDVVKISSNSKGLSIVFIKRYL